MNLMADRLKVAHNRYLKYSCCLLCTSFVSSEMAWVIHVRFNETMISPPSGKQSLTILSVWSRPLIEVMEMERAALEMSHTPTRRVRKVLFWS